MHLLIAWMFGNYAQIACAQLTLSIKLALCYVNAILFITPLNTTWIPLHMLFGMDIAGANQTARPIATPSFRYTPVLRLRMTHESHAQFWVRRAPGFLSSISS